MEAFLLLLVCPLALANQYIRQPYPNDDFSVSVKFGQNATLKCEDQFVRTPSEIDYWILPNNVVMHKGENISLPPHPIDGVGSWEVSFNASEIYIVNVMEVHFGIYHCMVKDQNDERYAVKRGLNYNGPYFGDLWPVYRTNTMVGGIAAAVFVVIVTILYIIYIFKCKSDDAIEQDPNMQAYDNAYVNADTLPVRGSMDDVQRPEGSATYVNQGYAREDEVIPYPQTSSSKAYRDQDTTQL